MGGPWVPGPAAVGCGWAMDTTARDPASALMLGLECLSPSAGVGLVRPWPRGACADSPSMPSCDPGKEL